MHPYGGFEMNKNTIIGIALMVVLFVGFGIYQVNVSEKQAEQQAAFSVSQDSTTSITDESSARILDTLDRLAN